MDRILWLLYLQQRTTDECWIDVRVDPRASLVEEKNTCFREDGT
jgi:hypothetical protein